MDQMELLVEGNDLGYNDSIPNRSFGLRFLMIRRDPGLPGDAQFRGNVKAWVSDNRIVGNEVGVTIAPGQTIP
jgi:hypothetical protein